MITERAPLHVCLIDDDPVYTFGFKKLIKIKELASQITSFSNGNDAIMWLKDPYNSPDLPDVIFLDINMPVMDGWEFMREFVEIKSQLGKKTTIYMISSSIDLNDIYRAKNISDITDYIFKPINEHHLYGIMNILLEQNEDKGN